MHHFDIAIVGGGLSGLIRADLLSRDPNHNLKIAILDPNPAAMENKTYATWFRKSTPSHPYSHLVTHRWNQIRVTGLDGEPLERTLQNHTYEVIPGEKLYAHLKGKLLADTRFKWLESAVQSIAESSVKDPVVLQLASGESISASHVYNSIAAMDAKLFQSFVGVEVSTDESCFDPASVHLMDFSVPQNDEVRFVYTLPFSDKHALIEYTAFSKHKPEDSDLDDRLMTLIEKKFAPGSYRILRKESGAIPMEPELEPRFAPSFQFFRIESIGAAANRIKPSTGYSFARNLEVFAKEKKTFLNRIRFDFYDRLFLDVIRKSGGRAGDIFFELFRNNPVDSVFLFLSEKTTFLEELKLLLRLPIKPFLTELGISRPFLFASIFTVVFQFLKLQWAVWLIPCIGLITIGMAHGSLDVVLSGTANRLRFLNGYLARILLCVIIWLVSPAIALGLFLIQSADHFGEAQWIRLLRTSQNSFSVRIRAWIWGLFASLFGVLFHWNESKPLIHALLTPVQSTEMITEESARTGAFVLLLLAFLSSKSLDRFHLRVYGTPGANLISTAGLAISLMILPLLPGFLCFFAFWHGWDTMKVQLKKRNWDRREYVRQAAPYTLLSYFMILILMALFKDSLNFTLITKILIIAISALTAAHAPAMKRFLFDEVRNSNAKP